MPPAGDSVTLSIECNIVLAVGGMRRRWCWFLLIVMLLLSRWGLRNITTPCQVRPWWQRWWNKHAISNDMWFTGTEKQHVADDYALRLAGGNAECKVVVDEALSTMMTGMLTHFCDSIYMMFTCNEKYNRQCWHTGVYGMPIFEPEYHLQLLCY